MESASSVMARMDRVTCTDLLQKVFPKNSTAWTLHVDMNASGVHHTIIVLGLLDGKIINVSAPLARVMENPYDNNRHGVRMTGGGLDLGHHAVDWLSRHLHHEGNLIHQVGL